MIEIEFDAWKAEYEPRIYDQSSDMCEDDHEICDCEFLYTVNLEELADEEDDANAVAENRIWTWMVGGKIVSGVQTPGWDFLITKKAYTEPTEVN
jgi:hypothetical protein